MELLQLDNDCADLARFGIAVSNLLPRISEAICRAFVHILTNRIRAGIRPISTSYSTNISSSSLVVAYAPKVASPLDDWCWLCNVNCRCSFKKHRTDGSEWCTYF